MLLLFLYYELLYRFYTLIIIITIIFNIFTIIIISHYINNIFNSNRDNNNNILGGKLVESE